jgi:NAD(P)-dependent dehydrogenase (short-subunit alcohol dehydrogenase family)
MILEGKTVLVTGVGGGLGRECAAAALRDGANVVVAARSADTLATIAAELDPSGEKVAHHVTDITDADSCAGLVDLARERFGSVDALVQVAAFENAWGGLYDMKDEDWRSAFDTNVLGAMNVIRPAATAMKAGATRPPRARCCRPCTTCATSSGRTTSAATWSSPPGCGGLPSRCS